MMVKRVGTILKLDSPFLDVLRGVSTVQTSRSKHHLDSHISSCSGNADYEVTRYTLAIG